MLNISNAIYKILSGNTIIQNHCQNRLFPIVADLDTPFPFLVYKRSNYSASYTKDGCFENHSTIVISVVSEDYDESIQLIQAVRTSLDNIKGLYNNIDIHLCRIDSANESTDGKAYVQEITFNIETN